MDVERLSGRGRGRRPRRARRLERRRGAAAPADRVARADDHPCARDAPPHGSRGRRGRAREALRRPGRRQCADGGGGSAAGRDVRRRRRPPFGRARDRGTGDSRPLPRSPRAARERHRLPHRRLPLQGHGRRHRRRRAERLRRPDPLDHGAADVAPARDADPSRPHAPFHGRRRMGAEPVHPDLARPRSGGC